MSEQTTLHALTQARVELYRAHAADWHEYRLGVRVQALDAAITALWMDEQRNATPDTSWRDAATYRCGEIVRLPDDVGRLEAGWYRITEIRSKEGGEG